MDSSKKYRILRVIEYEGSRDFIDRCIQDRSLKGEKTLRDGSMRESILGDVPTLFEDVTHTYMGGVDVV